MKNRDGNVDAVRDLAVASAKEMARKVFENRGNRSKAMIYEAELTLMLARAFEYGYEARRRES